MEETERHHIAFGQKAVSMTNPPKTYALNIFMQELVRSYPDYVTFDQIQANNRCL